MKFICTKCGKKRKIEEPYHQKGFGWFVGAFCSDCNYLFAEIRNAPSKEKAIELLERKITILR